jgi:hypothetical protein
VLFYSLPKLKDCRPDDREQLYLDPEFPQRLTRINYHVAIEPIQFLFEKYAKSVLSNKSDRKIAISGLLERMKKVLKTEGGFGVFEDFLSRLLLWRRLDGTDSNETDYKDQGLPSWSWMTYSRIHFIQPNGGGKVPVVTNLRFEHDKRDVLLVQVRGFHNCEGKPAGSRHVDAVADSKPVGELWFDMQTDTHSNICTMRCVVIWVRNDEEEDAEKTCYILLVEMSSANLYKRVGLGRIRARCISETSCEGKIL